MPYTVNVIRERRSENAVWVDTFLVQDSVKNPEEALRAAVDAFLKTDAGKKAVEQTCEDFNWGDAMLYLSAADLAPYGLERVPVVAKDILVDQDEVLCS